MNNKFFEKYAFMKWIFLGLLLLSSFFHFYLSLENGEKSSELSSGVSEEIVTTIEDVTNIEIDHQEAHSVIRKLFGHFLWFTLIGVFAYLTFRFFFYKKYYLGLLLALSYGIFVAIISELCQLISLGRSCEIKDMLIDYGGFIMGITIPFIIYLLISLKNKKKNI